MQCLAPSDVAEDSKGLRTACTSSTLPIVGRGVAPNRCQSTGRVEVVVERIRTGTGQLSCQIGSARRRTSIEADGVCAQVSACYSQCGLGGERRAGVCPKGQSGGADGATVLHVGGNKYGGCLRGCRC